MSGPALQERLGNYIVRKAQPSQQASATDSGHPGQLQPSRGQEHLAEDRVHGRQDALDDEPRVRRPHADPADPALEVQGQLRGDAPAEHVLPRVAPAIVGTSSLDPNIGLLKLQPSAIALAYGAILDEDAQAPSLQAVPGEGRRLPHRRWVWHPSRRRSPLLPKTAKLTYTNSNGEGEVDRARHDQFGRPRCRRPERDR